MSRAAIRENQDGVKGLFPSIGKPLALGLFSAALGTVALLLPAQAQGAQYNWKLTNGTVASGGGSKLEILIPPGNSPLGRFDCIDNQGAGTYTVLTLAANIGALKSGAPAKVSISTPQGKHSFSGLAVEVASGGGIKGITFSLANNHPVWPALANGAHFDYQVDGFAGSRLSLTSSNGTIGQFANGCGISLPRQQNNAVVPRQAPALVTRQPTSPQLQLQRQPQQQVQRQPQQQAAPVEQPLPFYRTRPGRSAWGNTNYRLPSDGGRNAVYTARVKNAGLAFHTYCTDGARLKFFISPSGNRYPDYNERVRQGLRNSSNVEFSFKNSRNYQVPMFLDSEGNFSTHDGAGVNSDFVREFLKGRSFSVNNAPFGSSFQLKSSKKAICKVVNRCGVSSSICGGKARASSKRNTRSKHKRCRPRSVYVAGRGCILKRYLK